MQIQDRLHDGATSCGSKRESRPNNKFKCLNYDHPFTRRDLESTTNEFAPIGT